jgi:hypothetical protein
MIRIADGSGHIHTPSESQRATPFWLDDAALVVSHLQKQSILNIKGEPTRNAFSEAVRPFVPADY